MSILDQPRALAPGWKPGPVSAALIPGDIQRNAHVVTIRQH